MKSEFAAAFTDFPEVWLKQQRAIVALALKRGWIRHPRPDASRLATKKRATVKRRAAKGR